MVDGDDLAVALDEAAGLDRRAASLTSTARAAASAAAAGSEPASTKLDAAARQSSTVPSWVASSCAVSPSSETVGRLESWRCPPSRSVGLALDQRRSPPRPWP